MASLSFEGVHKRYGETVVLERVDLEVSSGEYLVLVGPSGCGKSTLLRCIAGLEVITSGTLSIDEIPVNDLPPRARDVAMVFQSYALYPHMTVAQNVGFPLRIQKLPPDRIAAAVAEAAQLLDLTELLDRFPSQLSGGQRQRVAMGRAIVRRPKVFLFDEPLSNLDASLRHHMRVELKRLHRSLGATIVHVTHDQVEALTLADRILVLHEGIVQQVGTPRELFEAPANTFVARFIGAPSMNLLQVTGHGDHCRVRDSDIRLPLASDVALTIGVRPTDLMLTEPRDDLPVGTVDVIESHGAEAMVHVLLAPGRWVVARAPEPLSLEVGQQVGLRLGTVHRFDPETGVRL
ncbi:MAG TPA: sn-glycerol-3-phosphate ABC transporter ATP-binding protein UgpC [Deltaproteobacteria bacterium]|nr:sn-glycerol-3-phosphate ABC transporter ATP-binding protein UgpC [Deltaproteobacteria bacterium]